jgi:hypothetical protein
MVPRCYGAAERKRVETATTPTMKKYFLRDHFLDTEKEFMKLYKDIIVRHEAVNRKQIIAKSRNMKNIFKFDGRG